MVLEIAHIVLMVSDVASAREFYLHKLCLPAVEEHPNSFAFAAGSVRVTISPGGRAESDEQVEGCPIIIFRTDDIERAVTELTQKGVAFDGKISEAPGFMRFVSFADPGNNPLMLAQYLRDPLEKV